MKTKSSWLALSPDDIEPMSRQIDVEVPERGDGRTSDHTERYCLARLLHHVSQRLDFPLMAVHTDKPDFLLVSPLQRIGVEHVEAVPEDIAEADFLRGKGHGPEMWYSQRAKVGEKRKSSERIKREIEKNDSGEGWVGDTAARDTAEAIVHFATRKAETCSKDDFRRFDKNWLVIYNNWPGVALDLRKAIELARPGLIAAGVFSCFDLVAVIDSSEIALISAEDLLVEPTKYN